MNELIKITEQNSDMISSRQIAEVTGKNHYNVMVDIRYMCNQADVKIRLIEKPIDLDTQGVIVVQHEEERQAGAVKRMVKEYLLNEMAANVLALGYDVKRRIAILQLVIKMKVALEAQQQKFKLPTTRVEALLRQIVREEMANIIEERDIAISNSGTLISTTEIAKILGMLSAIALNKFLCEKGIQYREEASWKLCQEYAGKGYAVLDRGNKNIINYWTVPGQEFIINLYKSRTLGLTRTK